MNQQPLLFQILKVPVFIIKFLSNIVSIATYVPNYIILSLVDNAVFSQYLQSNLCLYMTTWIFRFLLLNAGIFFFCIQFYLIFYFLQLQNQSLLIQIVSIFFTLGGLLVLMRKGYQSMIKKYKLSKLKSPLEHFEIYFIFLVDIITCLLTLLNLLLISNFKQTLEYEYKSNQKFIYLKHITSLIKLSLIQNIQFFYVKIFFRIFPWRFLIQKFIYQQQKQKRNLLNCIVLLTLVYFSTMLDLVTILIFGLFNVAHPKRKQYYKDMGTSEKKWKITITHFIFIVLQTIQLFIELLCFPVNFHLAKISLLITCSKNSTAQLFGQDFKLLIQKSLIKIPYLYCLFWIYLLRYKYQRKKIILGKIEAHEKTATDEQKAVFQSFAEQIEDILYYPLILIATLVKIWKIKWIKYILTDDYTMDKKLIIKYTFKTISQPFYRIFSLFIASFVFLYDFQKPVSLYKKSANIVEAKFLRQYVNIHQNAAPIAVDEFFKSIATVSMYKVFYRLLLKSILADIPSFPCFILCKISFLFVFNYNLKPSSIKNLFQDLQITYYRSSVEKSKNFKKYKEILNNYAASGYQLIKSEQLIFWKYAHKCNRHQLIQYYLKLLIPQKSLDHLISEFVPIDNLSEISNQYWNNVILSKKLSLKLVQLVITIIVTIFALIFMVPLTLWRFPTFVILYKFHNNKIYFFKILFCVYKQLVQDILHLLPRILAFIIAPKQYIQFIVNTSFKYGLDGLNTFKATQQHKENIFRQRILIPNLQLIGTSISVVIIYLFWLRIRIYNKKLAYKQLKLRNLFISSYIYSPNIQIEMQLVDINSPYYKNLIEWSSITSEIFIQTIKDIPYWCISILVFLTMPWRINYLIKAFQDIRNLQIQGNQNQSHWNEKNNSERRIFINLLKNIGKDYACIIMSIILLISFFKTKVAWKLIKRNYKLNFFIGFLSYSYYKQLKNQIRLLFYIYADIWLLFFTVLFGWTNTPKIIKLFREIYQRQKAKQQASKMNQKIYKNTVKEQKELQVLNKMGLYDYMNVCSYLSMADIVNLRKTSKYNYLMTKRQQIWFTRWESVYSSKYNYEGTFQEKCIMAYQNQSQAKGKDLLTYHDAIYQSFQKYVFNDSVDIRQFLRLNLNQRTYNLLFFDFAYSINDGYGSENELPQAEDQDEQFLRLTNQVRRPRIEYEQNMFYLNWIYQKPVEKIVQKMHSYFRFDTHRRVKQLILIFGLLLFVLSYFSFIWLSFNIIFHLDRFIGVKIIFTFYFHSFIYLLFSRSRRLYIQSWIALKPFDLKDDFINFVRMLKNWLYAKIIVPIGKFFKKCLKKLFSIAKKGTFKIIQFGDTFVQKVIKPLYIYIAEKIIVFKNAIVAIFKGFYISIKYIFRIFYNIISTTLNLIKSIFSGLNNTYYKLIEASMIFFLNFGILGNLIFTLLGLVFMTLPSILYWFLYQQRWFMIVSTIQSMVLVVFGYKHMDKIRKK